MKERKALYLQFCQSTYIPLHLQPWWLDAVCTPDRWDVVLVKDGGGTVIAAMPYFRKRRWGLWVVQQAPLTTYAGPWIRYPEEPNFKLQSRYSFEKKVFAQLIAQLPRTAFFLQNFRPEIENWLPFYWDGFQQTTRYTYIFDNTANVDDITAGMKNTLRSDLKKAAKAAIGIQEDDAAEIVFQLNALSMQRKNLQPSFDYTIFQRLHNTLAEHGQMACFIARDRVSGEPHAGLYLTCDAKQAYVLLTGIQPKHKGTCAVYSLFMEAIKWCGERGLSLDFEGSMQPEIEHIFRSFGARQQAYFQVWRARDRFLEWLFYMLR